MQDKVSIAATKEKVSNAAAKGGKAFMSLIQKVTHSSEDPKPTGILSEPKSPGTLSELKSPGTLGELKSPGTLSEPKSPRILGEPKPTGALCEPKSPGVLSESKSTGVLSEPAPTGTLSEPASTGALSEPTLTGTLSESAPTGTLNDLDGDSDEPTANSPKTSMERKGKLVNRLKRGLKVGKKSTDAENRSELLDGSPHDQSPRVRSTDSIKVKYGHKPSTDPTSIAAQNREKLIERQEKLQAMNMQSEEMVEGAENFASMAEELAKKIENRPWYKL